MIGSLGFVPGLTSNYGTIMHVGAASQAHLLGLFQVSAVHNVVHLVFGTAGLLAAHRLVLSASTSSWEEARHGALGGLPRRWHSATPAGERAPQKVASPEWG
ncbi:DUF4383 domain-containing protein [Rhodococcus sp. F64268]|uniref:DUF4383 domain-containing protein n=1 Tax=Rhodococcus sp. F64268 TaxID=2926402 RepID=UPI001FF5F1FD|nr:DUF4383 domain-containing protein [Rhodococcus sp. F64268]MCK0090190.1 DUF4383 domain-containing protein [Rhodococcus sp. F64268]